MSSSEASSSELGPRAEADGIPSEWYDVTVPFNVMDRAAVFSVTFVDIPGKPIVGFRVPEGCVCGSIFRVHIPSEAVKAILQKNVEKFIPLATSLGLGIVLPEDEHGEDLSGAKEGGDMSLDTPMRGMPSSIDAGNGCNPDSQLTQVTLNVAFMRQSMQRFRELQKQGIIESPSQETAALRAEEEETAPPPSFPRLNVATASSFSSAKAPTVLGATESDNEDDELLRRVEDLVRKPDGVSNLSPHRKTFSYWTALRKPGGEYPVSPSKKTNAVWTPIPGHASVVTWPAAAREPDRSPAVLPSFRKVNSTGPSAPFGSATDVSTSLLPTVTATNYSAPTPTVTDTNYSAPTGSGATAVSDAPLTGTLLQKRLCVGSPPSDPDTEKVRKRLGTMECGRHTSDDTSTTADASPPLLGKTVTVPRSPALPLGQPDQDDDASVTDERNAEEEVCCYTCGKTPCEWIEYAAGVIKVIEKRWDCSLAKTNGYVLAQPSGNQVMNNKVRFAFYRAFTYEKFGCLGKGCRIKIPSCVEKRIKDLFPDLEGNYTNFIDGDDESSLGF